MILAISAVSDFAGHVFEIAMRFPQHMQAREKKAIDIH
jgi:hypothetical protein